MNIIPAFALALAFLTPAAAQSLPPVYDGTPEARVPSSVVKLFPVKTFLENLVAIDGAVLVTNHEEGVIYRLDLMSGEATQFLKMPGKVTGIAPDADGAFVVSGIAPDGVQTVTVVGADGKMMTTRNAPEAKFLNGVTMLSPGKFLIADSFSDTIFLFDRTSGSLTSWLKSDLLARPADNIPVPGVNGLKMFQGALIASNTIKSLILRIPVNADGTAGAPEVWREGVWVDDFVIAEDGTLYGATHVFNTIVKVAPDGAVSIVATTLDRATGSTALAFQPGEGEGGLIFVTNGGMFLPPPEGIEEAAVVILDISPDSE